LANSALAFSPLLRKRYVTSPPFRRQRGARQRGARQGHDALVSVSDYGGDLWSNVRPDSWAHGFHSFRIGRAAIGRQRRADVRYGRTWKLATRSRRVSFLNSTDGLQLEPSSIGLRAASWSRPSSPRKRAAPPITEIATVRILETGTRTRLRDGDELMDRGRVTPAFASDYGTARGEGRNPIAVRATGSVLDSRDEHPRAVDARRHVSAGDPFRRPSSGHSVQLDSEVAVSD
jgi:hypothetical protein